MIMNEYMFNDTPAQKLNRLVGVKKRKEKYVYRRQEEKQLLKIQKVIKRSKIELSQIKHTDLTLNSVITKRIKFRFLLAIYIYEET